MHKASEARLLLVYRDFTKVSDKNSHVGLGVTAKNIASTLTEQGLLAEAVGVTSPADVGKAIDATVIAGKPVTHVVIGAFWVPTATLKALCQAHHKVHFTVVCHSNVGFLVTEPAAITLLYEALDLQRQVPNFVVGGNSVPFRNFVARAFQARCMLLPNLYDLATLNPEPKPAWDGKVLRIGCFGALRSQKNVVTAAGAALIACAELGVPGEFWVSTGRNDGGAMPVVLQAVKAMLPTGGPVKLVENGWQDWSDFRATVRKMDVLMQPSFTESWNVVTADGISQGVPSVVSTAIRWAPKRWHADSDDASDVARKAVHLVRQNDASSEGRAALVSYVTDGVRHWRHWLVFGTPRE